MSSLFGYELTTFGSIVASFLCVFLFLLFMFFMRLLVDDNISLEINNKWKTEFIGPAKEIFFICFYCNKSKYFKEASLTLFNFEIIYSRKVKI